MFCLEALHTMEATSEQNLCTSGNAYVYVQLHTLSGGSKSDHEEFRVLTQSGRKFLVLITSCS